MKKSLLALSCAASALAFSDARAQSLTDAINEALAAGADGNCAALGAGVTRFEDTWQVDPLDPSVINFTSTDPAQSASTISPPITLPDGAGRNYVVRPSDVVFLQPTVAQNLSEQQLYDFLVETGVQLFQVDRFATGNFGAGLGGLCQSLTVRVNQNGNTSTSGGFAGGSSSASGRSVSSLSSARDQSKKEKKRKKKSERNASYDDGYVRLASNEEGLGVIADAAGVGPLGVETFLDFRGGYTDIDRAATALESGFEGRALWGQGSLTAELAENFAISGSISYSLARGDFDGTSASGGANGFRERNVAGALFALASLPIGGALTLDLAAGGFYGGGSGEIERVFLAQRQNTYLIDTRTSPTATIETLTLQRSQSISDDLLGDFRTRNYGFSAAASVSLPWRGFVVTPGVEFTWFSFRQDGYDESVSDAFNNGLALSYSEFKDRWTETRLGGALSRQFGALRLEGYGDLVLTGGAATPTRTATFVEDLRADPYVLSYQIDDLDKAFGVFGLVAALSVGDGVEAFVGGETNVAHDYLQTRSVFAGVRFRP